jgi:hypothetical protein
MLYMPEFKISVSDRDGEGRRCEEHSDAGSANRSATLRAVHRLVGNGTVDGKHVAKCSVINVERADVHTFSIVISLIDYI